MTGTQYMQRCFDLALLGKRNVSPNPVVGAVLVFNDRIIGEGFHEEYGKAHAEVNAIRSVKGPDRAHLKYATLYVSLEPCCFHGKTPPCTNLIIGSQIPRVVISCLDNTPEVAGKGVAQLREAGIKVTTGVLEAEGRRLTRPRSVFATTNRPYIILKYAQSRDGKFCPADDRRQFWITNSYSKRLVHKWRSETDAILVGSRTAQIDDPQLTNRFFFGPSPLRIVIDREGKLSSGLQLFSGKTPTLVVTHSEDTPPSKPVEFLHLKAGDSFIESLLYQLHARRIGTLMVEGGVQILQTFLNSGYWDEARILVGDKFIPGGRAAPDLGLAPLGSYELAGDQLLLYQRPTGSLDSPVSF